jgi:hypothetical protein
MFQRRGSKVESKKRYGRKKFKKIENFSWQTKQSMI